MACAASRVAMSMRSWPPAASWPVRKPRAARCAAWRRAVGRRRTGLRPMSGPAGPAACRRRRRNSAPTPKETEDASPAHPGARLRRRRHHPPGAAGAAVAAARQAEAAAPPAAGALGAGPADLRRPGAAVPPAQRGPRRGLARRGGRGAADQAGYRAATVRRHRRTARSGHPGQPLTLPEQSGTLLQAIEQVAAPRRPRASTVRPSRPWRST